GRASGRDIQSVGAVRIGGAADLDEQLAIEAVRVGVHARSRLRVAVNHDRVGDRRQSGSGGNRPRSRGDGLDFGVRQGAVVDSQLIDESIKGITMSIKARSRPAPDEDWERRIPNRSRQWLARRQYAVDEELDRRSVVGQRHVMERTGVCKCVRTPYRHEPCGRLHEAQQSARISRTEEAEGTRTWPGRLSLRDNELKLTWRKRIELEPA